MAESEKTDMTQPIQKEQWREALKELLFKQGVVIDGYDEGAHQIYDEQISFIQKLLQSREDEIREKIENEDIIEGGDETGYYAQGCIDQKRKILALFNKI